MATENNYDNRDFVIIDGKLIDYRGHDKTVVIPDTVKVIGRHSFPDTVVKLYIPASVEVIETYAFISSLHLEEIEVAPDNPVYYSKSNCVIERKTKKIIKGTRKSVIPEYGSVTAIGTGAFHDVDGSIFYIRKCITEIESCAFDFGIDETLVIECESRPEGWEEDWDNNVGLLWEETDWEGGASGLLLEWGAKFSDED